MTTTPREDLVATTVEIRACPLIFGVFVNKWGTDPDGVTKAFAAKGAKEKERTRRKARKSVGEGVTHLFAFFLFLCALSFFFALAALVAASLRQKPFF